MAKRSDLKQALAPPTQQKPWYLHTRTHRNQRINSLDAKLIKLKVLCHYCNTTRTQPHDRAWEELSSYLLNTDGALTVRPKHTDNEVFTRAPLERMVHVQLFLMKLWGCHLYESNLLKELIGEFAACIMQGRFPVSI